MDPQGCLFYASDLPPLPTSTPHHDFNDSNHPSNLDTFTQPGMTCPPSHITGLNANFNHPPTNFNNNFNNPTSPSQEGFTSPLPYTGTLNAKYSEEEEEESRREDRGLSPLDPAVLTRQCPPLDGPTEKGRQQPTARARANSGASTGSGASGSRGGGGAGGRDRSGEFWRAQPREAERSVAHGQGKRQTPEFVNAMCMHDSVTLATRCAMPHQPHRD